MPSFLCSLLSSILFTSIVQSYNNGGFTVDLFHRDSIHSPSYDPTKSRFDRLQGSFDRYFSRKSSFIASSNSIDAPIISAGGEYLMKIGIGTPPVEVLVIADTGSDLTWIQCRPCKQCYKQNLPIFDPSRSSSYIPVSYKSGQCAAASDQPSCDRNKNCQYQVFYGDSSHSAGELAAEILTLDRNMSFPIVVLGCGHDNQGSFNESGSGLVGLGGGSISIINQLRSSIGGRFSYCLALLDSNATSKISFGRDAIVAGPNAVSTPIVKKSPSTFYFLTLEGISVGSERIDYVYSRAYASAIEGNIIIDSGTALTYIPLELYEGVESALVKAITGSTRVPDPLGIFKLCYHETGSGGDGGGELSSTPISAHFKGAADLALPQETTFIEVAKGISCLTLMPSQGGGIFGNLHQMNYQVGYDVVKGEVSFLPTDCSNYKPL